MHHCLNEFNSCFGKLTFSKMGVWRSRNVLAVVLSSVFRDHTSKPGKQIGVKQTMINLEKYGRKFTWLTAAWNERRVFSLTSAGLKRAKNSISRMGPGAYPLATVESSDSTASPFDLRLQLYNRGLLDPVGSLKADNDYSLHRHVYLNLRPVERTPSLSKA